MSSLEVVAVVAVVTAWCLTLPVQTQVSKCCGNQEIFYQDNMTCGHTEISEVTLALLRSLSVAASQEVAFNFLTSRSDNNCSTVFRLESNENYSIENQTGFLIHDGYPDSLLYCAEVISPGLEVIVLKCHQETNSPCPHQAAAAYKYEVAFTVLGVISLVFLLLTFYVYISLPDLHNLHGKIVLSNVVSVFLVTLYLIIVFNILPSTSIFCLVLGYLGYFTSIAMFSWMTVFCFDLCRTFCTSTSPNSRRTKTFIIYSASAWGTALAFTTTIMVLDIFLPEVSDFKPNIGHSTVS